MKKIIITISLILISLWVAAPIYAQNDTSSKKVTITCEEIGKDQTGFYVILEEPIGGPDAKYCFRVCPKLEPGAPSTTPIKTCKLLSQCSTSDKDLGSNVSCQRVQVIFAESGIDLLNQYIRMIYLWAAGTIGIVAVFTMVYSGIGIMTAGGDSGKIDTYKNRIMQSLVGLVVLFLSGLILYTINPTFFV